MRTTPVAAPTRSRRKPPTTLYDLSREQLTERLAGQPRYRVDQAWSGLYEQLTDLSDLTTLPNAPRAELSRPLPAAPTVVAESQRDAGETLKRLCALPDGTRTKTALTPHCARPPPRVPSPRRCAMSGSFYPPGPP